MKNLIQGFKEAWSRQTILMDRTHRLLAWLLFSGILAAVVVLAAYFKAFGRGHLLTPSQDPEDWARFGEYVGGCLGATFGLLAFVGVILTIYNDRLKAIEEKKTTRSTVYFQQAEATLRTAVNDFLNTTDEAGRPKNSRRHWLNFARGVSTAQKLGERIEDESLKEIWTRTEHYWRERVYDVLDPTFESYPAEYYGYTKPDEQIKNFSALAGERMALSEPSLVFVYRWIVWPPNLADDLDRSSKFDELEIEKMHALGPRGLANFIRILRAGPPQTDNGREAEQTVARRKRRGGRTPPPGDLTGEEA
jgi:hypothetical protein